MVTRPCLVVQAIAVALLCPSVPYSVGLNNIHGDLVLLPDGLVFNSCVRVGAARSLRHPVSSRCTSAMDTVVQTNKFSSFTRKVFNGRPQRSHFPP